jgi:hypothetical protein
MGKDPAGHMHKQLQPPFSAACSTLVPLDDVPARRVTVELAAVDVDVPARPAGDRLVTWAEAVDEDDPGVDNENAAAAVAVPFPARLVKRPAVALCATVAPVEINVELLCVPAPRALALVIPLIDAYIELLVDAVLFPDPARTVTVAVVALLEKPLNELLVEALVELEVS